MSRPVRSGFHCFFSLTARAASGLCACLCLAAALAFSPSSAMAESVYWYGPGSPENSVELREIWWIHSLAPSGLSGNEVFVYGDVSNVAGDLPGYVFGGYAYADGGTATASHNSVSIMGGTMGGVHGGSASASGGTATASHNSVSIMGGTMSFVYGGDASAPNGTATVSHNSVSIMGGTVQGSVYGGDASAPNGTATASHNSVSIMGGTVLGNVDGGSASAFADGTASHNSVSIMGGTVGGRVVGGWASAYEGTATASHNSVSIMGGTVLGNVDGGSASAFADGTATASHNSVSIMGGTVLGDVYGGLASAPDGTATASHNSVSIMGGTVQGDVFGGYASAYDGTATYNTVTLSGAPVFGGGLYGGYGGGDIDGDIFTGNRLRLWDYQGASTLSAVANFAFYDFILPAGMADGGVLLRANTIAFGNNSGENSTITGLNVKGGGRPLSAGDTVTLLAAGSMIGDIEYNAQEITDTSTPAIQGQKGVSLLYTFTLSRVGDNLYATVAQDPQVNPQTKALSEGRVAGLAFVNQGADLAAGQALAAARAATADTDSLVVFSAVQGGGSRYHSGSHVDVDGFSVLAGLGRSQATDYGTLLLGAFMEAGVGNYDSHNSFASRPSVSGSGDTTYQGGGLLGRFDFNRQASGHAYAAASLRLGWSETDFSSSDLVDAMGQEARYTSGALYYGAHAALGYVWDLSREDSLDFSLAWLWTHQNDDKVSVVGDPVHFKAADSHRLRGGLRYAHDFAMEAGALLSPYAGAAYEHEFDGRARADVYGRSMDAPKLSGGTGMGEFGVVFRPGSAPGLSLDLGVQGYSGKREGVTGSLAFNYEF